MPQFISLCNANALFVSGAFDPAIVTRQHVWSCSYPRQLLLLESSFCFPSFVCLLAQATESPSSCGHGRIVISPSRSRLNQSKVCQTICNKVESDDMNNKQDWPRPGLSVSAPGPRTQFLLVVDFSRGQRSSTASQKLAEVGNWRMAISSSEAPDRDS